MATTFIKYNQNKGFSIAESFIQLAFHYIYEEARKPQYSFSNKTQLLNDLKDKINGVQSSYLTLSWNRLLSGPADEETIIEVLQNVNITLEGKGSNISSAELQVIDTEDGDFKYYYDKPFPTSELLKILNALIQIIQGIWAHTNFNMQIDYGSFKS